MSAEVIAFARGYSECGYSVVPIRGDGSKAPTLSWKRYQKERISDSDIDSTFADKAGVAIICGEVSGHLEVIDFDEHSFIQEWENLVSAEDESLLVRLPRIVTPTGGVHIYLRSGGCDGNLKLAWKKEGENSYSVAIETRGEGGYVLAPGCSEDCHEDGGTYDQVSGPPIADCPVISDEERAILLSAAYALNQKKGSTEIVPQTPESLSGGGPRPGDQFNKQAQWAEVLRPSGWALVRKNEDGSCFWQRPGKDGAGCSATTGHCSNDDSGDLLYVFSSNAEPFESERAYSKFSAFALLNHDGDFTAASRALLDMGYGCDPEILSDVKEAIAALNTLIESGVDLAIPEDTIAQLKQIDGKFRRTWEMKRSDFARDVSRYDTSIIWYCCEVGLDIKQMVSVLYKFRIERGIIDKHPLMAGSIAAKIARINDHPDTHDSTLMKEEITEVSSTDDVEHVKSEIRARLGLEEFSHLEQHGRDENTIFYLVPTDGQRVKIGSETKLMTLKGFSAPILRWFHKVIPNMKGWQWDATLRLMLQTCVVDEMPDSWEGNQMAEWVGQYLRERPVCDDENWKEAALHGMPFEHDGKLHLHIEGLMKWIALTKWGGDGKIASHTVRSLLKTLGFQHEKKNVWVDGKSHCRSFWTIVEWKMPDE